jgi:hypothetical protein
MLTPLTQRTPHLHPVYDCSGCCPMWMRANHPHSLDGAELVCLHSGITGRAASDARCSLKVC